MLTLGDLKCYYNESRDIVTQVDALLKTKTP